MLQKTFGIYANDLNDCSLFIEVGKLHIACWCKDSASGILKAFEFFQFDEAEEKPFGDILQEARQNSNLINGQSGKVAIIWNDEDCLCIPSVYYEEEYANDFLDTMFGNCDNCSFTSETFDDLTLLSRQDSNRFATLKKVFPTASYTHKFNQALQKYNPANASEASEVNIIFYPSRFIMIVAKEKVLQFVQNMPYTTSEDALYNIMQVCHAHNMPVTETRIVASGLINMGSNLYNTLFSYLDNFEIENAGTVVFGSEQFAEYPAHYFLPFI